MKPDFEGEGLTRDKNRIERYFTKKTLIVVFLLSLPLTEFGFTKPPKDIKKSFLSQRTEITRITQENIGRQQGQGNKEANATGKLKNKTKENTTQESKTKKKNSKSKTLSAEDYLMSKDVAIPSAPTKEGVSIRISLNNQRAWIFQNGELANVSPVTTGKPGHRTPKGKFHVINKHRHWTSTIYKVPMPYFLRLNPGIFGLHQGKIHTSPASHGCIRLPEKQASEFFALASKGTPVWIED